MGLCNGKHSKECNMIHYDPIQDTGTPLMQPPSYEETQTNQFINKSNIINFFKKRSYNQVELSLFNWSRTQSKEDHLTVVTILYERDCPLNYVECLTIKNLISNS